MEVRRQHAESDGRLICHLNSQKLRHKHRMKTSDCKPADILKGCKKNIDPDILQLWGTIFISLFSSVTCGWLFMFPVLFKATPKKAMPCKKNQKSIPFCSFYRRWIPWWNNIMFGCRFTVPNTVVKSSLFFYLRSPVKSLMVAPGTGQNDAAESANAQDWRTCQRL